MPLPLNDPGWKKLKSAYGKVGDVIRYLEDAYTNGFSSDLLGDLINEIAHQGDTSSSMYAVVPHLLELTKNATPRLATETAVHVGLIHAASLNSTAVKCPEFLAEEFKKSGETALKQLCCSLAETNTLDDFKYHAAALAGVLGHGRFSEIIEGFDFYEGKFYHTELEDPFP